MKEIFEGPAGKGALIDALKDQIVFNGNAALIAEAAELVTLQNLKKDEVLISEGGKDADLFFVLKGAGVQICVDSRPIGAREPGQCVGEMAALEPNETRSATVVGIDMTAVAKLPYHSFRDLSEKYPADVLRGVARTVAKRLRERKKFIRPRAATPRVFIGSSTEALELVRALQLALSHESFVTALWTDGVFKPSSTAIEDLAKAFDAYDFALFALTADDELKSRGTQFMAPRDNVLLELGMFIGALGRERVLVLAPKRKDFRRPSDLFGVNVIEYDEGKFATAAVAAIGHVASEVRTRVKALGPR